MWRAHRAIMPDGPDATDYDHAPRPMTKPERSELTALLALFAGALAIGSSGIFVRVSETGAVASAFWRGALALPPLALWALLERRPAAGRARARPHAALLDPMFFWAGVFFAADIALYHL